MRGWLRGAFSRKFRTVGYGCNPLALDTDLCSWAEVGKIYEKGKFVEIPAHPCPSQPFLRGSYIGRHPGCGCRAILR